MSGGNQTCAFQLIKRELTTYSERVGALNNWMVTRQLKQVSTALKRAEHELHIEREQALSYLDDAADAHGEHLTIGNAATRDEAFRASKHSDKASARVNELAATVTKLRLRQDELLDKLGSQ